MILRDHADWMAEGLCVGEQVVEFFSESEGPGRDYVSEKAAKAICRSCPVKNECLRFAMDNNELEYGVWGGMIPAERRAVVAGTDPNTIWSNTYLRTRAA